MPGKRTNDSVEKILEELNRQQLDQSVRSSVNEQQVDDILRSVGISVGAPQSTRRPQDPQLDSLLSDLLPTGTPKAAPIRQEAPRTVSQQPAPRPAARPESPPAPAPEPASPVPREVKRPTVPDTDTGTVGDTTSTGIIKNFLLKMAPDADYADTDALDQGKKQFKDFFGNSVAVVPDEKGRLRDSRPTGNTGEFVPINVALGGGSNSDDAGQDHAARPAKKRGGLFGLFGRRNAEEPEPAAPPAETPPAPAPQPAAAPTPAPAKPAPQPVDEDGKAVYRSKYTASRRMKQTAQDLGAELGFDLPPAQPETPQPSPAVSGVTLSGDTLAMLRSTVNAQKAAANQTSGTVGPQKPAADKPTGTVYRKKRDTVEFIPRKKEARVPRQAANDPTGVISLGGISQPAAPRTAPSPAPQNAPRAAAEPPQRAPQPTAPRTAQAPAAPAPAPVNTYTSTGFTVQMDPQSGRPLDSTQDFLAAFDQVRPRVQPAPQPMDLPDHIPEDRQELDRLVDTITGQIRLDMPAAAPAAPAPAPQKTQRPASDFVNNIADSINAQATAQIGDLSQYDEAASRLMGNTAVSGTQPAEPEKTSVRLKKLAEKVRLTGTPADEKEPSSDGAFTEELPRLHSTPRYESAEDAPSVRRALDNQVLVLQGSTILTGILALVMLYLGIAVSSAVLPIPAALDPAAGKSALLGVMLGLLVVCGALCWRTLANGIKGLAGRPTADSMPTLAMTGSLIQLAVLLFLPEQYAPSSLSLLAGPAALLLCFNNLGKTMDACSQRDGFKLVSANVDHAVAYRLKDAGVLRAVTNGLAEPRPSVLVSRPTQLFKGFLNAGAARRTSDKNQQQFAWALTVCAVAGFVVTMIRRQSVGQAVTAMAAVLVLGTPLAGTLLSALPARLMQRSAAQVGAVIPGWKDIRQLGRINVIQITARDLFPSGCVTLSGINSEHIDQAIIYAASMLSESGSLLREVFLNMFADSKLIAKVADRQTIYGKGYAGWIDGQRVLVGNRMLMMEHGVRLPSLDYEQRHTVNQRRVVYLAVGGKLFAMFQFAYQRDPDTAAVLDSLRRAGLSIIVDCDDFNVDAALLEAAYSLRPGAVKVLNGREREAMAPATAWLPESEGNMLHLGSFISFVGGLEAAAGAAEGERKAAMVMCASVLFSCLLSLIMVFSAGLTQLALPYIVLYQTAWAVLALIFPIIQRY